jgi:hypothetical protein
MRIFTALHRFADTGVGDAKQLKGEAGDFRLRVGAVEFPDFGATPIDHRWNVRKINVLVSFCGDGGDVFFLFPGDLPHRLRNQGK